MEFQRQTTRRLHEEHEAAFEMCSRLEQSIASRGGAAPAPDDLQWAAFARRIDGELGNEVMRHFDFEERSLFPLLDANGEGEIAELLAEEHEVIRACAAELRSLLGQSRTQGVGESQWRRLSMLGRELAERLVAHAQKEEMALLPVLDDMLAEEEDRELFAAYACG